MLVHRGEHALVHRDCIFLSQISHPLLFELFLIVGHHKLAHILVRLRRLEQLAINGRYGIFGGRSDNRVLSEHNLIYQRVVAFLEYTFHHLYAYGAVVEGMAQSVGPILEVHFFKTSFTACTSASSFT